MKTETWIVRGSQPMHNCSDEARVRAFETRKASEASFALAVPYSKGASNVCAKPMLMFRNSDARPNAHMEWRVWCVADRRRKESARTLDKQLQSVTDSQTQESSQ